VAEVEDVPRYRGCVSWIALDHPVDVSDATPILSDAARDARMATLTDALGVYSEAPRR
jgi:hypothetical protein